MSDGLTEGAQIRAKEITKQGTLGALNDHTRPDGSQWYTVFDGKYNFPGENLDGGSQMWGGADVATLNYIIATAL